MSASNSVGVSMFLIAVKLLVLPEATCTESGLAIPAGDRLVALQSLIFLHWVKMLSKLFIMLGESYTMFRRVLGDIQKLLIWDEAYKVFELIPVHMHVTYTG